MIVADASFVFDWITRNPEALAAFGRHGVPIKVIAPAVVDLEILQGLRRHLRLGTLDATQTQQAFNELQTAQIERRNHETLLPRIWQLRENMTAYDASYVALAEELNIPLWTRDAKIKNAPALRAEIILI